ncbi:hypothetical protein D621_03350 [beta proteobacterium AAP51]|nr:hypothetical protein D621_03350 [beta proteobacterium AAP51]
MNAASLELRPSAPDTATLATAGAASAANAGGASGVRQVWRTRYLFVLTWAFTLLNSARVLSYLPTLWALASSGDSSQHSLWTWGMWMGANITMAAWLYEQQGQRWNRAVAVNLVNASMCAATFLVIAALRL